MYDLETIEGDQGLETVQGDQGSIKSMIKYMYIYDLGYMI